MKRCSTTCYDTEHVPSLSQVSGVLGVTRYKREELIMNIGGERRTIRLDNEPTCAAVVELESPDVLTSTAWDKAVEEGRWPAHVRPHTRNRRHILLKIREPES